MDLSVYINTLLGRYNSVVLPNFGAFEWRYFPAKLEALGKELHPPSYQLYFNEQHTHDDANRLVNFLAKEKDIALIQAKEQAVSYRLLLEEALLAHKEAVIPGIGVLKISNKGKVQLQKSTDDHRLVHPSADLKILPCTAIIRDKSYLHSKEQQPAVPKSRRAGLIVTALLLLGVGVSSIWWGPLLLKSTTPSNGGVAEKTILPAISAPQERFQEIISDYAHLLEHSSEVLAFEEDVTNNEAVIAENEDITPITELEPESPKPEIPNPKSPTLVDEFGPDDYIIVIGVFGNQNNIDRNARLLSEAGYEVEVKELYTGFTRVSAVVNCSSEQELQEKYAQIRQEFTPNAWIVER